MTANSPYINNPILYIDNLIELIESKANSPNNKMDWKEAKQHFQTLRDIISRTDLTNNADLYLTIDQMAEYTHHVWAHWMKYFIRKYPSRYQAVGRRIFDIPSKDFERWQDQIDSNWDLPDDQKASDYALFLEIQKKMKLGVIKEINNSHQHEYKEMARWSALFGEYRDTGYMICADNDCMEIISKKKFHALKEEN